MYRTVGVSDRGVLNRLVNLFCVLPIPDGDAKRHKVYTGSGNRRPTSSLRDRTCIPCTEVLVVGGYKLRERGNLSQVSARVVGPFETLLSSGWKVCLCVCYPGPLSSKWPKSSPFIVEGGTRAVHVLLCGVVPIGTACPSPVAYSCSGVVIGVAHPWSTGVAWSSHQVLCVVGAPGMPRSGRGGDHKPLWTDYARGRNLVGAEAGTAVGGSRQARTPMLPRP